MDDRNYENQSEEPIRGEYHEDRSGQFSGSEYNRYSEPGNNKGGNGLGTASLVLGIASLIGLCFCLGPLTGILAIIFGIIQLTRTPENRAFSIAGIITGAMGIILTIIITVIIALGVVTGGSGADSIFDTEFYEEVLENKEV